MFNLLKKRRIRKIRKLERLLKENRSEFSRAYGTRFNEGDKFCWNCGSKLYKKYLSTRYDSKTGEKVIMYTLKCSKGLC